MPNAPVKQLVRTPAASSKPTLEMGKTDIGWVGILRQGEQVQRLWFGYQTEWELRQTIDEALWADRIRTDLEETPHPSELFARMEAYARGESVDFSDIVVAGEHLTEFGQRVVRSCREIPFGQQSSYARLAEAAGSPGAARAVGNVMANNRTPIIVPCHRVVGSGGALGGFSAPGGLETKRRLLDAEAASTVSQLSGVE